MIDPFRIEGPASISFSGGRTSGYMLWRILQAWGGKLPEDVVVTFANTGKEMPETLDFVQECSERWDVPITWVEFRSRSVEPRFEVVDYRTASRNGEPFAALIESKSFLPNPTMRFCTVELKIVPMARLLWHRGWTEWDAVIGYRADEPSRLVKMRNDPSGGTKGADRIAPLGAAGITKWDVLAFWQNQSFDLGLPSANGSTLHGNCDLCFLKGGGQVLNLIRENPKRAAWWMSMEGRLIDSAGRQGRFRSDRPSYAEMHRMALDHGEMFAYDEPLEDCACTD